MWSLRANMAHGDNMGIIWWMIYSFNSVISTLTLYSMPVFEPNEYFWANHWDGKEERWVAYARAIRKIIARQGNFELSDLRMEDKFEFKNAMRKSKTK